MRQPQRNNNNNNNRSRGRGGGRKSPNPMSRSFESNGPDVKIRGNASTIAEKYTTLGRDAQSAGDRVMAENYLQHAEHYNRLVAAATAQQEEKRAQEAQQRAEEPSKAENEHQPAADTSNEASSEASETNDENTSERPRTNGRGRNQRTRRPKNQERVASDEDQPEVKEQPKAGISEDALGLPDSIVGAKVEIEASADE